jgi:hypothetical protein
MRSAEKRRECLHEAIDFIRVLASFEVAKKSQKRLKYRHFDSHASPVFLSPKKTPNLTSVSSKGA